METAALALRINTRDAHEDDVERAHSHSRLVRKADESALVKQGQVVHVCFPVIVPGEDGRVIPFGRYNLTVSHQDGPPSATLEEVVLVNLDTGAHVVLSVRELTAIVRDPDVEII